MDIITHNRNKDEKSTLASKPNEHEDIELQVSGSESTRAPFVAAASEDLQ